MKYIITLLLTAILAAPTLANGPGDRHTGKGRVNGRGHDIHKGKGLGHHAKEIKIKKPKKPKKPEKPRTPRKPKKHDCPDVNLNNNRANANANARSTARSTARSWC
jgi:hypothetical protein